MGRPRNLTIIDKCTVFQLPADYDPKAVAQDLNMSMGELIRISIKEYAAIKGVKLKPREDLSAV